VAIIKSSSAYRSGKVASTVGWSLVEPEHQWIALKSVTKCAGIEADVDVRRDR